MVSMLPLWFRANSVAFRCCCCGFARIPASRGLFRPLPPTIYVADRHGARGGTGPWFRRSRCGFARIPLRFDAPAVVSREFRCVSMLPLWFHANSVAFRYSRCGFARIPASRGLFRPLLGGPLRLPTATVRAVRLSWGRIN